MLFYALVYEISLEVSALYAYMLAVKLKLLLNICVVCSEVSTGELKNSGEINGNVENKRVIIYDDIIASGGTIKLCCDSVKKYGGQVWAVCATHGVFTEKANENLKCVERLVVTDTVPPVKLEKEVWKSKLHICRTTQIFAEAIRRTHYEGGSISELLD
jgi:ribose-phosphate pyrophosphokinase